MKVRFRMLVTWALPIALLAASVAALVNGLPFPAVILVLLVPPLGIVALWLMRRPIRLLALYLFLLPFDVYLSTELRFTSLQVIQLVLAASWILLLIQRGGPQRLFRRLAPAASVSLVGFLGLSALSLIWAIDPGASVKALLRTLGAVGAFAVFVDVVEDREQLTRLLGAFSGGALLMTAYGVVQYWRGSFDSLYGYFSPFYGEEFTSRGGGFAVTATFVNPNVLVGYATMVLPIVLGMAAVTRGPKRAVWAVGVGAMAGLILLTFSKGGWIVLAGTAGMWVALRWRAWTRIVGLAGILVVVTLLVETGALGERARVVFGDSFESSLDSRLELYRVGLRAFVEQPIGYGLDGFTAATERQRSLGTTSHLIRAHNLYLQMLVDLGLAGMLVWLGFVGSTLFRGIAACVRADPELWKVRVLSMVLGLTGFVCYGFFDSLVGSNAYVAAHWAVLGAVVTTAGLGPPRTVPDEARALPAIESAARLDPSH